MKKIYTAAIAVILLSVSAFSQQNFNLSNNVGHHINISNASVTENGVVSKMTIIGNPAKDVIHLQVSNPNAVNYELSLYNERGTKVTTMLYNHPAGVSTKDIYVSQFQAGIYFLVARSVNEKRSMQIILQ